MEYKTGDFLYYITRNKKVNLGEVVKLNKDGSIDLQDQVEVFYVTVSLDFCSESEKELKNRLKLKRENPATPKRKTTKKTSEK